MGNSKKLLVANWKMNKSVSDSIRYVTELKTAVSRPSHEVVLAPPFTALHSTHVALLETSFFLAAQNMHMEPSGAFTGEVSPSMLVDLECSYVILGHSERRAYFYESDELVGQKVLAALEYGLRPILCVGELEDERKRDETHAVIQSQLDIALRGVSDVYAKDVVIAYEPVWAIGTGMAAKVGDVLDVHRFIRKRLEVLFGKDSACSMRIIYGGSVNQKNIRSLLAESEIDGALIGSASLDASSFASLILDGEE